VKDTQKLIIEASLEVFSEKGYTSATTLEISKKANVSEMTLFRHFQTKHNLFIIAIKQAIGASIIENHNVNLTLKSDEFIKQVLHEKLLIISKQNKMIKMLIRETLANNLSEELAFTKHISKQVSKDIVSYVQYHKLDVDPVTLAQLIVGILLRYAIMEEHMVYHLLKDEQQSKYLEKIIKTLDI
jgi:AcrR family transcriptional regulator